MGKVTSTTVDATRFREAILEMAREPDMPKTWIGSARIVRRGTGKPSDGATYRIGNVIGKDGVVEFEPKFNLTRQFWKIDASGGFTSDGPFETTTTPIDPLFAQAVVVALAGNRELPTPVDPADKKLVESAVRFLRNALRQ